MKNIIISYGNDFFLNRTASLISESYKVILIQNYVPGFIGSFVLKLIDKVLKKKYYENKSSRKCLSTNVCRHCCIINDLYGFILKRMSLNQDVIDTLIAKNFGWNSKTWIYNGNIFHVRSGFGQGGAIKKAKSLGMITISDHSIAHPKEMYDIMEPEYQRYGIKSNLGITSSFWEIVLKDCIDADYVLVNSDYVKSTFIKQGFNPDKILVNYLGVRDDWFGLKKTYALRNNEFRLLFIGEFGIRKGAEYILKAISILKERNVKFKILVIGNKIKTKSFFEGYDCSYLEFIGRIPYEELKKYYQNSDAFLFPSLCEGSTRAGMEAMAAGMPVIMTENCGNPIINKINGIIVPIKNEYAIADAVCNLYESEALRERLGQNACKTIENNYTWNKYSERLCSFYDNVLNNK